MSDGGRDSWFERALGAVAPQWALRRARARMAARNYEAASGGRRTEGWRTSRRSTDANTAAGPSIERLRNVARDLKRNNGWARRGIATIANNTVGWGIVPMLEDKRAMAAWNDWADSVECDHEGRLTFYGLERLAMESIVESGEVLLIRHRTKNGGLRIQLLEGDYLDTLKDMIRLEGGGSIVQGVEFDALGRRVAYWLFDEHPGAATGRSFTSRRVDADGVLHVFLPERPGQCRGVSWLAAAVAKLKDFDDYEDAVLMQKKIASCFAAFVTDIQGDAVPLGKQDPKDAGLEELGPGLVEYLPPGRDIKFATPPVDGGQDTFTKLNLHRISAALGVTYEEMSSDFSQVTFSSARMGRIAHYQNVYNWRWHMMIPLLCDGVMRWWMEWAMLAGKIDRISRATWTAPNMPTIEPDKEGLGIQRMVRNGGQTLFEMIRERGNDPRSVLAEIAAGNAELDRLGIWLDCDPRRTSGAGLTQQRAGVGQPGDAGGEADPDVIEHGLPTDETASA